MIYFKRILIVFIGILFCPLILLEIVIRMTILPIQMIIRFIIYGKVKQIDPDPIIIDIFEYIKEKLL